MSKRFSSPPWRRLEPTLVFAERVAQILGAHPDPGPGDVDRAVLAALVGLWIPPAFEEVRGSSRWDRAKPGFERVSKHAR